MGVYSEYTLGPPKVKNGEIMTSSTINDRKFKHRPWLHPYVKGHIEAAVRERVLRWMAGTTEEALSHKYRGRHWAKCARGNAVEWPRVSTPEGKKRQADLVQKELCRQYRIVDKALRSEKKRVWRGRAWEVDVVSSPSQKAVDQFDQSISVKIENGVLTATDNTCSLTMSWNWEQAFPRTAPLNNIEAKSIVSYFHRRRALQLVDGQWVRGVPVQEPPMRRAELGLELRDVEGAKELLAELKRTPIQDPHSKEVIVKCEAEGRGGQ
jgi:hypothetical protein